MVGAKGGAKSGARSLEAQFQRWLAGQGYPMLSQDDSRNRNFGHAGGGGSGGGGGGGEGGGG